MATDHQYYGRRLELNWVRDIVPHIRQPLPHREMTAKELAEVVNNWARETDDWLRGLSLNQRDDVVRLLDEECDHLWVHTHHLRMLPGAQPLAERAVEYNRHDFRQRFFEGMPLVMAAARVKILGADWILSHWQELENYVASQTDWLP